MHYFSYCVQISMVALVFLVGPIHGNNWEPCGDWIQYNDEKCFKIIDDTLRTFDEAKDVCATQVQTSTLAVIRSSEEQQFLSDYLFKSEQKLENFWIGAKYSSQNGSFVWIDNTPLNYTNWDTTQSPRSLANYCVHMQADMAVIGKWKDGTCGKKNAVVCQKMQFWSTEFLQKTFLDSRKQQRDSLDTIRNLTQSLESANRKIASQKESLQIAYQRIDSHKQSLENVNQRINEQKQNFENDISNTNAIINEQKQSLDNANLRINEQKQRLANANKGIKELQNNIVPVGFIYIQLAHQPEPRTLWPTVQWQDVTSTYAGVFLRAEGGGSKGFGAIQEENAPRVTLVTYDGNIQQSNNDWYNTTLNVGGWSSGMGVFSGHFKAPGTTLKFLMSGGEIRPRNMAVRIWKREQ